MTLSRFVRHAAVTALAGIAFSTLASAAPTRLLGVYEEAMDGNCTAGATCFAYFSALTKPLKITKVSCNFYVNAQDVSLTGVQIGRASENKAMFKEGQYIAPVETLLFGATVTQYQFLADTLTVIPANWRPAIQLAWDKNATSHFSCRIAGSEAA